MVGGGNQYHAPTELGAAGTGRDGAEPSPWVPRRPSRAVPPIRQGVRHPGFRTMPTGRDGELVLRPGLLPTGATGWSTFSRWLRLPTGPRGCGAKVDSMPASALSISVFTVKGHLGAPEPHVVVRVRRVVVVAVRGADVLIVVVPRAAAQRLAPVTPQKRPETGQNCQIV
jgi:hypothetical protein